MTSRFYHRRQQVWLLRPLDSMPVALSCSFSVRSFPCVCSMLQALEHYGILWVYLRNASRFLEMQRLIGNSMIEMGPLSMMLCELPLKHSCCMLWWAKLPFANNVKTRGCGNEPMTQSVKGRCCSPLQPWPAQETGIGQELICEHASLVSSGSSIWG